MSDDFEEFKVSYDSSAMNRIRLEQEGLSDLAAKKGASSDVYTNEDIVNHLHQTSEKVTKLFDHMSATSQANMELKYALEIFTGNSARIEKAVSTLVETIVPVMDRMTSLIEKIESGGFSTRQGDPDSQSYPNRLIAPETRSSLIRKGGRSRYAVDEITNKEGKKEKLVRGYSHFTTNLHIQAEREDLVLRFLGQEFYEKYRKNPSIEEFRKVGSQSDIFQWKGSMKIIIYVILSWAREHYTKILEKRAKVEWRRVQKETAKQIKSKSGNGDRRITSADYKQPGIVPTMDSESIWAFSKDVVESIIDQGSEIKVAIKSSDFPYFLPFAGGKAAPVIMNKTVISYVAAECKKVDIVLGMLRKIFKLIRESKNVPFNFGCLVRAIDYMIVEEVDDDNGKTLPEGVIGYQIRMVEDDLLENWEEDAFRFDSEMKDRFKAEAEIAIPGKNEEKRRKKRS